MMNQQQPQQQEEKLLQKFNRARKRLIRNKLILVTILNFITLLAFIFAMSYYEWVWVEIVFAKNKWEDMEFHFWANLLYMRSDEMPNAPYQSFYNGGQRICGQNIFCLAIFYEFTFIGYLCFSIFVLAGCLQVYDFARLFYYICKSGEIIQTKDNFRHLVTIFTYTIGITLSAFSVMIIDPEQYKYGISFWICIGTLIFFISVIFYQQYSIRKMIKQALILSLLDKEKKVRANEIKHGIDIEMMSRETSKQEGITL